MKACLIIQFSQSFIQSVSTGAIIIQELARELWKPIAKSLTYAVCVPSSITISLLYPLSNSAHHGAQQLSVNMTRRQSPLFQLKIESIRARLEVAFSNHNPAIVNLLLFNKHSCYPVIDAYHLFNL